MGLLALAATRHVNAVPNQTPAATHFEEVSPLIEDIELKRGDPFIEVFITGSGHIDCYDSREYVVEKLERKIRIIARLRRLPTSKRCKLGVKTFKDKAADLDPQSPASYEVEVLGFKGWSRRTMAFDAKALDAR